MRRLLAALAILLAGAAAAAPLSEQDLTGKSRRFTKLQSFEDLGIGACDVDPPSGACFAPTGIVPACVSLNLQHIYGCVGGVWGSIGDVVGGSSSISVLSDDTQVLYYDASTGKLTGASSVYFSASNDLLKVVSDVGTPSTYGSGCGATNPADVCEPPYARFVIRKNASTTPLFSVSPIPTNDPFPIVMRVGERAQDIGDSRTLGLFSAIVANPGAVESQGLYAAMLYTGSATAAQGGVHGMSQSKPGLGNTISAVSGVQGFTYHLDVGTTNILIGTTGTSAVAAGGIVTNQWGLFGQGVLYGTSDAAVNQSLGVYGRIAQSNGLFAGTVGTAASARFDQPPITLYDNATNRYAVSLVHGGRGCSGDDYVTSCTTTADCAVAGGTCVSAEPILNFATTSGTSHQISHDGTQFTSTQGWKTNVFDGSDNSGTITGYDISYHSRPSTGETQGTVVGAQVTASFDFGTDTGTTSNLFGVAGKTEVSDTASPQTCSGGFCSGAPSVACTTNANCNGAVGNAYGLWGRTRLAGNVPIGRASGVYGFLSDNTYTGTLGLATGGVFEQPSIGTSRYAALLLGIASNDPVLGFQTSGGTKACISLIGSVLVYDVNCNRTADSGDDDLSVDDDAPEVGDFGALALSGDVTSSGLATTIAAGAVTTGKILDATITQDDVDDTATLASNPAYGASSAWWATTGLIFEGATSDNFETLLRAADPTADRVLDLPNATGTLVSTGDVGSVISQTILDDSIVAADIATGGVTTTEILDATIAAADIATDTITASQIATGAVTTAEILDLTILGGDIATDTITATQIQASAVGTSEIANGSVTLADEDATATLAGNPAYGASSCFWATTGIICEGSTSDNFETLLRATDPTADRVLDLPNATGTLVSTGDVGSVTSQMILNADIVAADIANDTITATQIAAGAVATSELLDGSAGYADMDNTATLGGNPAFGASSVWLATTGLIFEGATSDNFETLLRATDPTGDRVLDLPNGTGTLISTGDNGSVTSQMVANGALTLADMDATGSLAGDPAYGANSAFWATNGIIFEGATSDTFEGVLISADVTADRAWTLPNETGTLLTTSGSGNVSTAMIASGAVTYPKVDSTATLASNPANGSSSCYFATTGFICEGSTSDTNETLLTFADPTADRTITFPDASGTVSLVAQLFVSTSQQGNGAGVETDACSNSIAAGRLATDGESIEVYAAGSFAVDATDQVKAKFGATTIFDSGVLNVAGASSWRLTCSVIRTGAATQKAACSFASSAAVLTSSASYAAPAETLSGAITLKLTVNGTAANATTKELCKGRWEPAS